MVLTHILLVFCKLGVDLLRWLSVTVLVEERVKPLI